MRVCVCAHVFLYVHQFINSSVHQFTNLSIYQFIDLSIYQSIVRSIVQSFNLYINLAVNLSIHPSIHPPISAFIVSYVYHCISLEKIWWTCWWPMFNKESESILKQMRAYLLGTPLSTASHAPNHQGVLFANRRCWWRSDHILCDNYLGWEKGCGGLGGWDLSERNAMLHGGHQTAEDFSSQ